MEKEKCDSGHEITLNQCECGDHKDRCYRCHLENKHTSKEPEAAKV